MKNTIKIIASLFLLFVFTASVVNAENWQAPVSSKKKQNPYEASTRNISSGKKIYNINCKSCHGDASLGNMLPLQPVAPSDLGSKAFLMQTDGEIYYKINKGNGAMPTFEKTLSDEDKWMVMTYLRSFDKNKKVSKKIADVKNPKVTDVKLLLDINKENKTVLAKLTGVTEKGNRVALQGIELSIMVKRSFGYLDISGEYAYTNEKGNVEINFPADLPGDREGHVNLLVKVTDDAYYGEVNVNRIASIGLPTDPVNPLDERAMWGTRANAPVWIMLSYVGGVISVWGVIFVVLFQLMKLPKLAKIKE